jgi:2-keto-3-deoxy-L-arabinonate dehydratase
MHTNQGLSGVIPIVPTPFTDDEEVDEDSLRGLIEFAVSCEVGSVCLPAYASEFYKLSDEERFRVVDIAVKQAAGRLRIIAQANSASVKIAIRLAKSYCAAGADIIGIAVPRQFHLPESSLKEYLSEFLKAIAPTPVLIQDFNPGGESLSIQFITDLHRTNSNFKYLKLEEPLSAKKVGEIIRISGGRIELFEGWGGLYLMELTPVGIAGVMPGLALADLLQIVFLNRKAGFHEEAFQLFERVMPQIFFSLQNMELFHYAEKELLVARGILKSSRSRKAAYLPDHATVSYISELNKRLLKVISEKHNFTVRR